MIKKLFLATMLLLFSVSASATFLCTTYIEDLDEVAVLRWYVGQPHTYFIGSNGLPYGPDRGPDAFFVCNAWGDELTYIRNTYTGIPIRESRGSGSPVIWDGGEAAYFLFNNLGYK